jgi:hypothetical protein
VKYLSHSVEVALLSNTILGSQCDHYLDYRAAWPIATNAPWKCMFRNSVYTCWPVQAHEYPSTLDIEGALLRVTRPLSDQQLKCLAVIDDVWPETITPARLATRLEVPTNTAVAYVAILVNRGYVTRTHQQRGISYLSAKSASTS